MLFRTKEHNTVWGHHNFKYIADNRLFSSSLGKRRGNNLLWYSHGREGEGVKLPPSLRDMSRSRIFLLRTFAESFITRASGQ